MMNLTRRWTERPRYLEAAIAVRRLFADPQDTRQTFRVIRALGGGTLRRMWEDRHPKPMPVLRMALRDLDRLSRMDANSLGFHYAAFMSTPGWSAEELADLSEEGTELWYDYGRTDNYELEAWTKRLRDAHDLWHVVCGYDKDILGELAILAFTYEQTGLKGAHYIAQAAIRNARRFDNRQFIGFIQAGYRRGRNAVDITNVRWEHILHWDIARVRRALSINPAPPYHKFTDIHQVPTKVYR